MVLTVSVPTSQWATVTQTLLEPAHSKNIQCQYVWGCVMGPPEDHFMHKQMWVELNVTSSHFHHRMYWLHRQPESFYSVLYFSAKLTDDEIMQYIPETAVVGQGEKVGVKRLHCWFLPRIIRAEPGIHFHTYNPRYFTCSLAVTLLRVTVNAKFLYFKLKRVKKSC